MVAAFAARAMQRLVLRAAGRPEEKRPEAFRLDRFPEFPRHTRELVVPTSVAPARVVVYLPTADEAGQAPAVHVNFHGGGFVMPLTEMDDWFCRFVAAEAQVAAINVDYALAPRHKFPAPPRQAFEVVLWIAQHGAEQGWDGSRLSVGGQSAGGSLAAAVARQALEQGGPAIALQVLHYAVLDLATELGDKPSAVSKSMLKPWMGAVYNGAYIPDRRARTDRLASPANAADVADLAGIAPALVITAEYDRLKTEAGRYAERLRKAGALIDLHDVRGADHGYDVKHYETARDIYALIARHVRRATASETSGPTWPTE
nr:alpha/beta hydrolase [Catenulispora rubra]